MLGGALVTTLGIVLGTASVSHATSSTFDPPGTSITVGTSTVNVGAVSSANLTDLQVGAANSNDIVPVQLSVDSGSLSLGTTTGIIFYPAGTQTGATINFLGTRSAVNTALATLTVTKGSSDTISLTASLGGPITDFTCSNNHFYRVVLNGTTRALAKTAATAAFGGAGYLVTPTTDSENTCVYNGMKDRAGSANAVGNITWIGAVATAASGTPAVGDTVTYKWDSGPENNTSFWTKTSGATQPSTSTDPGATVNAAFAKWDLEQAGYQPNALVVSSTLDEPCVVFYNAGNNSPTWHDVRCNDSRKFIIETDATPSIPTSTVSLNFNVVTPTPSTSPTSSVSSAATADSAPVVDTSLASTSSTPIRNALAPLALVLVGISLVLLATYRSRASVRRSTK